MFTQEKGVKVQERKTKGNKNKTKMVSPGEKESENEETLFLIQMKMGYKIEARESDNWFGHTPIILK